MAFLGIKFKKKKTNKEFKKFRSDSFIAFESRDYFPSNLRQKKTIKEKKIN